MAPKSPPSRVAPAAKQAVDLPRQSMFSADPASLVIVGYDTDDGQDHPLWDPSCSDEPDETLAESLGAHGQLQPIVIRKNGERLEVVAGRGRTKAARLWNEANPDRPLSLRCTLTRGKSTVELAEAVIAENEHRKERPISVKARMAQRLIDLGRTEDQVATLYRVTLVTLRGWLESLDRAPEVIAMQDAGVVSNADAERIAHLTHRDQAAVAELAKETGTTLSEAATNAGVSVGANRKQRARGSSHTPSSRPGLTEIRAAIESKEPDDAITWREFALWVIGDDTRPTCFKA